MDNNLAQRLDTLENKIDSLYGLVQGTIINKNLNMNQTITEGKLVDLVPEIEHLENFETILETLNQLANELGYSFKKVSPTKMLLKQ